MFVKTQKAHLGRNVTGFPQVSRAECADISLTLEIDSGAVG